MTRREAVVQALRQVDDPEIGVNVVDLGLVYGIELQEDDVRILLSMTTPTCPLSDYLIATAERAITRGNPGVRSVIVEMSLAPPWTPEMMSDHARRLLGWK